MEVYIRSHWVCGGPVETFWASHELHVSIRTRRNTLSVHELHVSMPTRRNILSLSWTLREYAYPQEHFETFMNYTGVCLCARTLWAPHELHVSMPTRRNILSLLWTSREYDYAQEHFEPLMKFTWVCLRAGIFWASHELHASLPTCRKILGVSWTSREYAYAQEHFERSWTSRKYAYAQEHFTHLMNFTPVCLRAGTLWASHEIHASKPTRRYTLSLSWTSRQYAYAQEHFEPLMNFMLVSLRAGTLWASHELHASMPTNNNKQAVSTPWLSWLRHRTTSRQVAGSIPCGKIGTFHWHNPSDRHSLWQKWVPRTFSAGYRRPARGADNHTTFMCVKSGSLNLLGCFTFYIKCFVDWQSVKQSVLLGTTCKLFKMELYRVFQKELYNFESV